MLSCGSRSLVDGGARLAPFSYSGSLPYICGPLQKAIISRSISQRLRGGATFQEARLASPVGEPEALATSTLTCTTNTSLPMATPDRSTSCSTIRSVPETFFVSWRLVLVRVGNQPTRGYPHLRSFASCLYHTCLSTPLFRVVQTQNKVSDSINKSFVQR